MDEEKKEKEDDYDDENIVKSSYRSNKVIIWILIFVLLIFIVVKIMGSKSTGNNNNNAISNNSQNTNIEVRISQNELEIGKGTSSNLIINVSNNKNPLITWESENTSVASVSSTGLVRGIVIGETIITGTYIDENGVNHKAQCLVKVFEGNQDTQLTSAKLPDGDLMMPVNDSFLLTISTYPSRGYIASREFLSTNSSVVSVDKDGRVYSHKEGLATIQVWVNRNNPNYKEYYDEINVYVIDKNITSEIVINPISISLDTKYQKIEVGSNYQLAYTLNPVTAHNYGFNYSSSNPNYATVSSSGLVTALSPGITKIRVDTLNGKYDEMIVEVIEKKIEMTNIVVDKNQLSLKVGESYTIIPTVLPNNASNKIVRFMASDLSVLDLKVNEIEGNAQITAKKEGRSVITISSIDGKISTSITVDVEKQLDNNQNNQQNNNNNSNNNSTLSKTMSITSNTGNISNIYDNVVKMPGGVPTIITFKLGDGLSKVKYCLTAASTTRCKPTDVAYNGDQITLMNENIYRIRIVKYDLNGEEVIGTTSNYIEGALETYINTKSKSDTNIDSNIKYSGYSLSKVYETAYNASKNSVTSPYKVTFKIEDKNTTYKLKTCHKLNSKCTSQDSYASWYSSGTITLKDKGTWYITILEYNKNNVEISSKTWYITIK